VGSGQSDCSNQTKPHQARARYLESQRRLFKQRRGALPVWLQPQVQDRGLPQLVGLLHQLLCLLQLACAARHRVYAASLCVVGPRRKVHGAKRAKLCVGGGAGERCSPLCSSIATMRGSDRVYTFIQFLSAASQPRLQPVLSYRSPACAPGMNQTVCYALLCVMSCLYIFMRGTVWSVGQ